MNSTSISILGYDVFNPLEFCPEYTADVGIKKGEKVDYAILEDGKPNILIDVKAALNNLTSIPHSFLDISEQPPQNLAFLLMVLCIDFTQI